VKVLTAVRRKFTMSVSGFGTWKSLYALGANLEVILMCRLVQRFCAVSQKSAALSAGFFFLFAAVAGA
jgi:hypothetical protein